MIKWSAGNKKNPPLCYYLMAIKSNKKGGLKMTHGIGRISLCNPGEEVIGCDCGAKIQMPDFESDFIFGPNCGKFINKDNSDSAQADKSTLIKIYKD